MTLVERTVAVFSLGGTIAMTTDPASGGAVPALTGRDLLDAVPGLRETRISLRIHDFRQLPGASLTPRDLSELSARIDEELAAPTDGVVVTQGTDTIEETAYYLDLLHARAEPIVVTGAMRHPSQPGADGPANLYAAVLTAASKEMLGTGCTVVLGDEIHAAATVRKTHTVSPAAFASPSTGPMARLIEGRVTMHGYPPSRPRLLVRGAPLRDVRIGLHCVTFGDEGELLDLVDGRLEGMVIAAFGAGHVPEPLVAPLGRIANAMPTILASRIGNGSVLRDTYSFPGSEKDLLARGLISAGCLDPYKARLLLYLLVGHGADHSEILDAFAACGQTTFR